MQIRLTVVDPLGPSPQRGRAASRDVLVTAPTGTELAAVVSALAGAVTGEGRDASNTSVVLYAGPERLDPRRCTLGEPPLVDGAVLSLGAPAAAEPHPGPADAPTQLRVVAGPDAGGVHLLHGGRITVGRSAEADVPLDDPDVSRLHCAVTVGADGRVSVADLDSTNGTTLDGVRVDSRPVRFPAGGLLRVGESALRVAPSGGPGARVVSDGEGCLRVVREASAGGGVSGPGSGSGFPPAPAAQASPSGGPGGGGGPSAGAGEARRVEGASGAGGPGGAASADDGWAGGPVAGGRGAAWAASTGAGEARGIEGASGAGGPGGAASADDGWAGGPVAGDRGGASAGAGGAGAGVGEVPPVGPGQHGYDSAGWGASGGGGLEHRRREPGVVPGQAGAPAIENRRGADTHAGRFGVGGPNPVAAEPYAGAPEHGPAGGRPEPGEDPRASGRRGAPARGTGIPQGGRRRGLGAWARKLTGGRGEQPAGSGTYEAPASRADAGAAALARKQPETWPDPAALLLTALGPGPRLWERGPDHAEVLTVRLGTADRSTPDGSGLLPAVPVTAALREAGALGLAGPRPRLSGLARAVLAQLAALHSPDLLEIVLISADRARPVEERTAEWSWLGWLPHVRPAHGQDCRLLLAYDREQAAARAEELLRRVEDHAATGRSAAHPGRVPASGAAPAAPAPGGPSAPPGPRPAPAAQGPLPDSPAQSGAAEPHIRPEASAQGPVPGTPGTHPAPSNVHGTPAPGDPSGAATLHIRPGATAPGPFPDAPAHSDPSGGSGHPGSPAHPAGIPGAPTGPSLGSGHHANPSHPSETPAAPAPAPLSGRPGAPAPVSAELSPARPGDPAPRRHPSAAPAPRTGDVARRPSWAREDAGLGAGSGFPGPYTVVVVDGDPGGTALREAVARLASAGPRAGIHVVCLAETEPASPASPVSLTYEAACAVTPTFRHCGAVALLSGDVATALQLMRVAPGGPVGPGSPATVDAVSPAWAERFARALAPLRPDTPAGERDTRVATPLPQSARLLDELGLARATPASLMARWADAADDPQALGGRARAVLGAGPRGPLTADLVADGPHLLIEGPAGSGRTELLRAVVASLAAAERPDRLGVVLIDGRDGVGTGGAHGEGLRVCTDIPHVTTHLVANDPVRMREFAQSLATELKRRAELLGRSDFAQWHTGREVSGRIVTQRTPSNGDIEAPPSSTLRLRPGAAARRQAEAVPPLPRLVVVVDDLDALVSPPLGSPGRPAAGSVMRALEAVARDGERLGVHLVAAAGTGGRTAETEPARRATLRAVLDAPQQGPDEPVPGRGRLAYADGRAVGFQGGRVTGRIPRTATQRPTVVALDWQRMGDPPARRPVRELGNGPTDLALLASAVQRAAREVSAAEVPSLL
ncbi:FtsK/SpoIIIE domain-containing protein [Streptomyces durhamensis]|uniref:FtsK/SpoIIIE domain-containing protein n=1 Tax=Streptomyces durhamensis TaxID=68194 RepID=UPI0004CCD87C|nr:FtsK/SpoIIIE domain-containing protein [Streptomyces durhamensis]